MGDVPEYVTGPTLNDDVRRGLTISPELKNSWTPMQSG